MLAEYQGYVFEADQASQTLAAQLLTALGGMPHGKNYLAPYIETILNDALFTEVRERSNANFLWFIKFERSFRETEQELQSQSPSGRDARSDAPHSKKTKRFGDHEHSAEIVHLQYRMDKDDSARRQASGISARDGGTAAVIEFKNLLSKNPIGLGRHRE
jgi:hypothetical protein